MHLKEQFSELQAQLKGELKFDNLYKALYATDASVYKEEPLAVVFPEGTGDIKLLVDYAENHKTTLIPRTAGTSLAGQCVGNGIVVDVSRHFTEILNVDTANKTVTVQPGIIRDNLNRYLEQYGLFFGPNTSTSNRCMIGGMVGNNSSGTTSIQYGVTRDKVIAIKTVLSDGSQVEFKELNSSQFKEKCKLNTLEGDIYRNLYETLQQEKLQQQIIKDFPKASIHRRNTGYAIDALIHTEIFSECDTPFNLSKLLAGSEGTLAFMTEITLQLDDLPPKYTAMVASHFHTVENCLNLVKPAMAHNLYTCEMMDKVILDCTKDNLKYNPLRFFVKNDPKAILLFELRSISEKDLDNQVQVLLETISESGLSYANSVLKGDEIKKALELRKAGLGLLGNMIGDKKAVACIEDTAVALEDLSIYIAEFTQLMKRYNQNAVYYAHAGAGELHLRPILNLKDSNDVKLFRKITEDVAKLVKKYNGAMSGEHGDGRLRAEFLKFMVGDANYGILKELKQTWDPNNIFNAGKIIDAPAMDAQLRYDVDRSEPEIKTLLSFEDSKGILRLAEKCNGSGDCRKSVEAGGTMCPSYRATNDEKDTTRGRANVLREVLTNSTKINQFDSKELKDVFNLCISCKGCKSECPSNVDVSALKAEFEYQYQKANGFSLRSKVFAHNTKLNALAHKTTALANYIFTSKWSSGIVKAALGIAKERTLPILSKQTLRAYINQNPQSIKTNNKKTVYLFVDEFSNYTDTKIGIDVYELLSALGYTIRIVKHPESGRTFISKGFLEQAQRLANKNIKIFSELISEETPLIGIEPSAILSFRDEYLRLADDAVKAKNLAKHCFTIEEFLASEIAKGDITSKHFVSAEKTIKLHVHCHQKALSNQKVSFDVLNLPENYRVTIIPSGCCGMAGSFGYEKEHYDISMAIGEQTLFPTLRKADKDVIIAASGTSCRHQIQDGVDRVALHPVSILREALLQ